MALSLGVHLGERFTLAESVEVARECDQMGFDSLWSAEGRLTRDGIVPAALFAAATKRARIGTGVVNNKSRNAALMAVTFKTLAELAPSRVICGIGAWWEPIASKVGLPLKRPVLTMREYVSVMRSFFQNETVTFDGEFVHMDGVRFDSMYRDEGEVNVPIYFGAVGPQMLELAGEVADGVYLDFLLPVSYVAKAQAALRKGAGRSRRELSEIDIAQIVCCSVDDHDPRAAFDACKAFFTLYLCQQPHIGQHAGVEPELVERMKTVAGWPATEADIRRAMELLPDHYVRSVSACGSTAEAVEKLEEYSEAGVRVVSLSPVGNKFETIKTIGHATTAR